MSRPGLRKNRKFLRLRNLLEDVPEPHLIGYLHLLWMSGYDRRDDIIGDAVDVELASGWLAAGGEPGRLTKALLAAGGTRPGFLVPVDSPESGHGLFRIWQLIENASDTIKSRFRMRAHRERARAAREWQKRVALEESPQGADSEAKATRRRRRAAARDRRVRRTNARARKIVALPAKARASGQVARWAMTAKLPVEISAATLEATVVRCLREIRQVRIVPERANSAARQVISLWHYTGNPPMPLAEFADKLVLVARAAQVSTFRIFARDIRAEGWAESYDRSNEVSRICGHRFWGMRLATAEEWARATGRYGPSGEALVWRRRWADPAAAWDELGEPRLLRDEYIDALRHELDQRVEGEDLARALEECALLAELPATSENLTAIVQLGLKWCGGW